MASPLTFTFHKSPECDAIIDRLAKGERIHESAVLYAVKGAEKRIKLTVGDLLKSRS